METIKQFLDILRDDPSAITLDMVKAMERSYPFFTLPASLMLRADNDTGSLTDDERRDLMAQLALNAGDAAGLMMLVDPDSERWLHFYPPEKGVQVTTESAINTFLETYGHTDEKENALLERLIFNPTPDYASLLEQEGGDALPDPAVPTGNEQTDRLNAFIAKSNSAEGRFPHEPATPEPKPEPAPVPPTPASAHRRQSAAAPKEPPTETGLFSESLARIYVRRQKYEKAYEIISNLSRQYPDKSRYYDDQLRFLRKAVIARKGTK